MAGGRTAESFCMLFLCSLLSSLLFSLPIATASTENDTIRSAVLDAESFLQERQNYQFTGALAIYGSGGTTVYTTVNGNPVPSGAVQATCPADHPVSCTNIQEPYYCCPANNYCAWYNSVVSCCPNGETCQGSGSSWQPTTTYYQSPAATTVYEGGGGGYVAPATTTEYKPGGYGYCSTLVAVGPGLPTTEAGQCGTILIVEADAIRAEVLSWLRLGLAVFGLNVLGGLLLMRR